MIFQNSEKIQIHCEKLKKMVLSRYCSQKQSCQRESNPQHRFGTYLEKILKSAHGFFDWSFWWNRIVIK